MAKFSKTAFLAILLSLSLVVAGVFSYQWYRIKGELVKQTEEKERLAGELSMIKKVIQIKEETSFVQCRELKISPEYGVGIFLLNAWGEDWDKIIWKLIVIEPGGYGVGIRDIFVPAPLREAPTMEMQTPIDIDEDGTMDAVVLTGSRTIGDYLIIVEPGPDVSSTDNYGLQLGNLVLAKNIPFSDNLFDRLYILRQTETGIIPIVPASVGCQF